MSWSSVTAFLAAAQSGADPRAQLALAEIKSELDCDAQVVIDVQHEPSTRRLEWLQARTGRPWTAAQLAHVEGLTFVAIRRVLQSKGFFSSDLRASASPR